MKLKILVPIGLLALVGGVGAVALGASPSGSSECPGTIACPHTGEVICKDRCPENGASEDACPGTIVCPQTGEIICKDRCPLGEGASAVEVRPCCKKAAN